MPHETASLPDAGRLLAWAALGWLAMAVVFFPQFMMLTAGPGGSTDAGRAAGALALAFGPWVALTPAVLSWVERHPLRAPWARTLVLHAFGALATVAVHLATMFVLQSLLVGMPIPASQAWPRLLLGFGATDVLIYAALAAVATAVLAARRLREREQRLQAAELQTLKAQLQPHFLFNTLNAIAELGYEDPRRAEDVTLRLSAMLRRVLAGQRRDWVPLAEELALAADGLSIHQTLLGERLRYHLDVPPALAERNVPALVLQPLVENAVRHGVAPHPDGGEINILARPDEGQGLRIEVANTGCPPPQPALPGVGLANVRARLALLYGPAASLELLVAGGSTVARLHLPARARP